MFGEFHETWRYSTFCKKQKVFKLKLASNFVPSSMRVGLVVIVARFLTRYDYGLGAIVMTVREFTLTFANVGISSKIIQAEEHEVEALCNSAYWLNWTVFAVYLLSSVLPLFLLLGFIKHRTLFYQFVFQE